MVRNVEDLRLDEITEEFLIDQAIDMGTELDVDTRQGSIYRDAADGHIIRTAKFFYNLRQVKDIISIFTCTGEVLDERMAERGLARNPPEATPAKYYVEYVGAEPDIGDRVTCDGYFFRVDQLAGRWIIVSEMTGTELNNLVKGTPVIPEIDVNNLISATLGDLAVPAIDMEDDDSARTRFINKISGPDENANKSQVKTWCESVEGVGRARIIPLWNGPWTVKGIIISKDGGVPAGGVVSAVQEYLDPVGHAGMGEGKCPIGQFFTAEAAEAVKINVSVSVIKKAESSYEKIKGQIEQSLTEYCRTIAFETYSEAMQVRYIRVSAIIIDNSDIIDHDNLLLNGGTENITFAENQIPVVGEVTVDGNIL